MNNEAEINVEIPEITAMFVCMLLFAHLHVLYR